MEKNINYARLCKDCRVNLAPISSCGDCGLIDLRRRRETGGTTAALMDRVDDMKERSDEIYREGHRAASRAAWEWIRSMTPSPGSATFDDILGLGREYDRYMEDRLTEDIWKRWVPKDLLTPAEFAEVERMPRNNKLGVVKYISNVFLGRHIGGLKTAKIYFDLWVDGRPV